MLYARALKYTQAPWHYLLGHQCIYELQSSKADNAVRQHEHPLLVNETNITETLTVERNELRAL